MKKMLILMMSLFVMIGLSGCSTGGYDDYRVDYANYDSTNLTTLFLVDERGYAYAGIPYLCDSMTHWDKTAPNGAFSFVEPDTCEFDFYGLDGDYGYNYDEIVRIVDDTYDGKGGIGYECASFGVSSTYTDGSFEYDQDDICTFYL